MLWALFAVAAGWEAQQLQARTTIVGGFTNILVAPKATYPQPEPGSRRRRDPVGAASPTQPLPDQHQAKPPSPAFERSAAVVLPREWTRTMPFNIRCGMDTWCEER